MKLTRRGFLASAGAASVLVLGVRPNGVLAAGSEDAMLNPFVKIGSDGRVIAIAKHFEKGQGPATGLSTLIAEELGVRMDQITYEFAPSNPKLYSITGFPGFQGTGGSASIANSFIQYRQAGAAAREMLIAAAADAWHVAAEGLKIEDGMISGAGNAAPIGAFVAAASKLEPPADPKLTRPSQWRLIGNPDVRRLDSPIKVNGEAKFAMDVHLPNQMVAVIARPPQRGGKLISFDASGAADITGFVQALALPDQAGVVVYAENTWAAFKAREAMTVEWDFSTAESRSSDEIKAEILAALDARPTYSVTQSDQSEIAALVDAADIQVEQTFYFPLLAHAPMEPLNCTIEADADGGITLHDGCQSPTGPHAALAQIFGLPMDKVRINTMLAGGSFGRRATPNADYQVEAGLAFFLTDRTRPVKLVWSREDDLRSGYYRPAFGHKVRVGLTDGKIVGWDHQVAGQSIMKGTPFEAMVIRDGIDHSSIEGTSDTPYQIPGHFVGLTDTPKATSTLWWRSVGHTHTAYVMEVMMDMAAKAVGADPVDFRLSYLTGGGADQARKANVLRMAAEKSGWGNAPSGRFQGVAVHKSFGTYVAEVAEISGNPDEGIVIEKVTCVVDCGIPVNPDIIKAQMEGGIGYGIGHVMRDQITLAKGEVEQYNFPDYEPLRISDIQSIDVHIVLSEAAPTGVGEPGTPPSAPALANAIASASGVLVSSLPMSEEGVAFV